ncbi:PAS domain-containing protein [Sedimentitalea todarodis]|uniref:PAS domain-containing protein n=1 Tax=Sedimentitalea todarodis TaxID=1631240 RepID=A0ABU3VAS3_9RHOB|nr:PAS domain-containing protein [Sedimentitalea todarodis]MDU9003271.1 PAS domain-containing protein [Sedimentitalea todarodis]
MFSIFRQNDTGKVVAMDRFRSGASLSPIRQAEAYWSALRDGAEIPFRSQIDPRGLEQVLEYAFILERVAPGVGRFRLAGQHLCQLAGMEVRGMPVTSFFTTDGREGMAAMLEYVFDTPAVAELCLTGERQSLRGPCEARMILLPLKSDLGDCSRILGVLVADGDFGRAPRRFDIVDTQIRDLAAGVESREPAQKAVQGFAEAQTVLGGKAPWLRLVKTDE